MYTLAPLEHRQLVFKIVRCCPLHCLRIGDTVGFPDADKVVFDRQIRAVQTVGCRIKVVEWKVFNDYCEVRIDCLCRLSHIVQKVGNIYMTPFYPGPETGITHVVHRWHSVPGTTVQSLRYSPGLKVRCCRRLGTSPERSGIEINRNVQPDTIQISGGQLFHARNKIVFVTRVW